MMSFTKATFFVDILKLDRIIFISKIDRMIIICNAVKKYCIQMVSRNVSFITNNQSTATIYTRTCSRKFFLASENWWAQNSSKQEKVLERFQKFKDTRVKYGLNIIIISVCIVLKLLLKPKQTVKNYNLINLTPCFSPHLDLHKVRNKEIKYYIYKRTKILADTSFYPFAPGLFSWKFR